MAVGTLERRSCADSVWASVVRVVFARADLIEIPDDSQPPPTDRPLCPHFLSNMFTCQRTCLCIPARRILSWRFGPEAFLLRSFSGCFRDARNALRLSMLGLLTTGQTL